jgi:hypothetical protein
LGVANFDIQRDKNFESGGVKNFKVVELPKETTINDHPAAYYLARANFGYQETQSLEYLIDTGDMHGDEHHYCSIWYVSTVKSYPKLYSAAYSIIQSLELSGPISQDQNQQQGSGEGSGSNIQPTVPHF